jgi:hypothetical protein
VEEIGDFTSSATATLLNQGRLAHRLFSVLAITTSATFRISTGVR